jgi:hypothetical protein
LVASEPFLGGANLTNKFLRQHSIFIFLDLHPNYHVSTGQTWKYRVTGVLKCERDLSFALICRNDILSRSVSTIHSLFNTEDKGNLSLSFFSFLFFFFFIPYTWTTTLLGYMILIFKSHCTRIARFLPQLQFWTASHISLSLSLSPFFDKKARTKLIATH